ncbi:hypothetical protein GQR58_016385 [Nymphon striatum]|nr:hypothetical protein GQR58_016385 [Nymphon striatum]
MLVNFGPKCPYPSRSANKGCTGVELGILALLWTRTADQPTRIPSSAFLGCHSHGKRELSFGQDGKTTPDGWWAWILSPLPCWGRAHRTEVKQNGITVRKGPIRDAYLISFDAAHLGKTVGEIQTELLEVIYSAIGEKSMSLFFKEYRYSESVGSTDDTPENILTRFQQSIIAPTTTLWMYTLHQKRKRVEDVSNSEHVVFPGQTPNNTKRLRTDQEEAPAIKGSGEVPICQESYPSRDTSKLDDFVEV